MRKNTRQIFILDKSRIWNLVLEQIESANVRSYTFNIMSNETLIKEFWKLADKKPVVWFDGKSAKDRDKLRFIEVKVRFTLKMYKLIPVYDDNNLIYRSIVNYFGCFKVLL